MSDQRENKRTIILPENTSIDFEFEKMLKIFLKKSQEIIRELRERKYYIKPSEKRRMKQKEIERKHHIKFKRRH